MIKDNKPNKCFFVTIIPKWENWKVNTLSCKDSASKTVYTPTLFKQFGHEWVVFWVNFIINIKKNYTI